MHRSGCNAYPARCRQQCHEHLGRLQPHPVVRPTLNDAAFVDVHLSRLHHLLNDRERRIKKLLDLLPMCSQQLSDDVPNAYTPSRQYERHRGSSSHPGPASGSSHLCDRPCENYSKRPGRTAERVRLDEALFPRPARSCDSHCLSSPWCNSSLDLAYRAESIYDCICRWADVVARTSRNRCGSKRAHWCDRQVIRSTSGSMRF